jgi:hypothetical protein
VSRPSARYRQHGKPERPISRSACKRGLQVVRDEEWTPEVIVADTLAGIDRDRGS